MSLIFYFNHEKNIILKALRGINFDDAIKAISEKKTLLDIPHPNYKKYPLQRLLVVNINGYAYLVPYIKNNKNSKIFLKTIYPSRKFTKKLLNKK